MLLFESSTLKIGGGHGERTMSNAHVPSRLPPERAAAQQCEIRGSLELEFLQHTDELAKTEGGFSCPSVSLSEEKKTAS